MTELTQSMQTHCVGRYLIDVPKDFEIGTRQTVGYKRDVVITVVGSLLQEAFNSRMQQIEAEYKIKKHRKGWPYFYASNSPTPLIRLIERLESDTDKLERSRAIEGYKWSNGTLIKMVVKATATSMENPDDATMTRKLGWDVAQRKAQLTKLLDRVRARATTEIPTEPGLCFDGGFLPGKAGDGSELEIDEELDAGFSSKKMPDISMNFNSSNYFTQEATLLEGKDLSKLIAQKNGKVLRQGSIKLAGVIQAEEWLAEGETDNANLVNGKRLRGHYFKIEANSKVSSPQTPLLTFTMRTGNSVLDKDEKNTTTQASLTDAQAIVLWDSIAKTLRLRPGAV